MPQDGIIIGNINPAAGGGGTYTAGSGIVIDLSNVVMQGGQLDGDVSIDSNGHGYTLGAGTGYNVNLQQNELDIEWQDSGSGANGSLHIENSYAQLNHTDGGGAVNFIQMYNTLMKLFHKDSSGNQAEIDITNEQIRFIFNPGGVVTLSALFNYLGLNVPYGRVVGFENNAGNAALSLISDGTPSGNNNALLRQSGGTIAYLSDLPNLSGYFTLTAPNQTVQQVPTFQNAFNIGNTSNIDFADSNLDNVGGVNAVHLIASANGIIGDASSAKAVQISQVTPDYTPTDLSQLCATIGLQRGDNAFNQNVLYTYETPGMLKDNWGVSMRSDWVMCGIYGEILRLQGNGALSLKSWYSTSSTPVLAITDAANIGSDAVLTIVGNNMNGLITLTTGAVIAGYGDAFSVTLTGFSFPTSVAPVLTAYLNAGPYPLNNQYVGAFSPNSYHVGFTSMLLPNTVYQFTYYNGGY